MHAITARSLWLRGKKFSHFHAPSKTKRTPTGTHNNIDFRSWPVPRQKWHLWSRQHLELTILLALSLWCFTWVDDSPVRSSYPALAPRPNFVPDRPQTEEPLFFQIRQFDKTRARRKWTLHTSAYPLRGRADVATCVSILVSNVLHPTFGQKCAPVIVSTTYF